MRNLSPFLLLIGLFTPLQLLTGMTRHPAETFLAQAAIARGLPAITQTVLYPEIDVIEWTLSNQMKVCAHLTNSLDQEVRLQAFGEGGSFSVPTIDRTSAEISGDIAIESGIGTLNGGELNAHLYNIHAELSTNVLAYSHMIEGACPTEQLPTFLNLLHTLFAHPRFEKAALPPVIERELHVVRSQEADAESLFERARFMMNTRNASVFSPLTEESIKQADYDAAWKWYKGVFLVPQQMIVLIVGDYDAQALRQLVLRYLATIPIAKNPLPLESCSKLPSPEGVEKIVITGRTLRELEPLIDISYFPPSQQLPFPLRNWETVAQVMESALRTAFIKATGSTHGIDVALEFPLYPCIHPFWVTLGFRSPNASIERLITVAQTTLEDLSRNGTTEKEIERALELQERNDTFWSNDKAYFIAHLASGYHLGGGPKALLPQAPPTLAQINHFLREFKTHQMTIGILKPTND